MIVDLVVAIFCGQLFALGSFALGKAYGECKDSVDYRWLLPFMNFFLSGMILAYILFTFFWLARVAQEAGVVQ